MRPWHLPVMGLYLIYLGLLTLIALVPVQTGDFGWVDSAAFLYIGQEILHGRLPYLDAWDHKPPLIFYLNALGLWLAGGSLWGIWSLAMVFLLAALALCYGVAARVYGRAPAVLAATCFCASLIPTLDHYNLTEFFALPLQMGLFYLFLRRAHPFWLGWLAGLLFLLRQNLIGAGIAVALGAIFRDWRTGPWRCLRSPAGHMLTGFAAIVGLTLGYFYTAGCLREAYEAFLYNFTYIHVPWSARGYSVLFGARAVAWVMFLGATGAIFTFLSWSDHQPAVRLLLAICVGDLALEVALSSLSGNTYTHYFMAWTPALALLAGHWGYVIARLADRQLSVVWGLGVVRSSAAFLVIAAILLNFPLWNDTLKKWPRLVGRHRQGNEALAAYIVSQTEPQDAIFVWGYAPEVYLLARRTSASRFFFQKRLMDTGRPPDRATIQVIVQDLERTRPRLLIDSFAVPNAYVPLDIGGLHRPTEGHLDELFHELQPLFRLVRENYELQTVPEVSPWRIHRRK